MILLLSQNINYYKLLVGSHPVEVWVWVSLSHPFVLTDLLHCQPSAGLQH